MANNTFEEFEELRRSIQDARNNWENGMVNPKKTDSYMGIWKSMNDYRIFYENERSDEENRFKKLEAIYNADVVTKNKRQYNDELVKLTSVLTSAFKTMITNFTESKHKQVMKMVRTAPTESMLNMLGTLKMRDDLDAVELHDIMPLFYENYHAMRALQSISRQNGITLTAPVQMDCTAMHRAIDKAKDYLIGACDEMFKKKGTRTHYNDFFTVNSEEPDTVYAPQYKDFIAVLDYVPQLQDFTAKKNALTATEKAKIDWYYRDVTENTNKTQLAQHTKEVMEKHPDDVALLKLSKYAEYVDIVEKSQESE